MNQVDLSIESPVRLGVRGLKRDGNNAEGPVEKELRELYHQIFPKRFKADEFPEGEEDDIADENSYDGALEFEDAPQFSPSNTDGECMDGVEEKVVDGPEADKDEQVLSIEPDNRSQDFLENPEGSGADDFAKSPDLIVDDSPPVNYATGRYRSPSPPYNEEPSVRSISINSSSDEELPNLHSPWNFDTKYSGSSSDELSEDFLDSYQFNRAQVHSDAVSGGGGGSEDIEFEVPSTIDGDWDVNPIEDPNSSSECDDDGINDRFSFIGQRSDEAEFADCSDETSRDESMSKHESEALKVPRRSCHYCKMWTEHATRCCISCFQQRKQWLPERPRLKRPKKSIISVVPIEHMNRTDVDSSEPEASQDEKKTGSRFCYYLDERLLVRFPQSPPERESASNMNSSFNLGPNSADKIFSSQSQPTSSSEVPVNQSILLSQESGYVENKSFEEKPPSPSMLDGSYYLTPEMPLFESSSQEVAENCNNASEIAEASASKSNMESNLCTVCFLREKNTAFVHYKTAHLCCCYSCADKILRDTGKCPICRKKILRVVKVIEV